MYPASAALAGLVPCALAGISTVRARVAAVAVIGADHLHAGELAVRAGGGLQRDRVHAADLGEHVLQLPAELERALRARRPGAIGCRSANPGRRAATSLASGLYFIVHEPSG